MAESFITTYFKELDLGAAIKKAGGKPPILHNAVPPIKKNVRRSVLIHEGNTNKPSGNLKEKKNGREETSEET